MLMACCVLSVTLSLCCCVLPAVVLSRFASARGMLSAHDMHNNYVGSYQDQCAPGVLSAPSMDGVVHTRLYSCLLSHGIHAAYAPMILSILFALDS